MKGAKKLVKALRNLATCLDESDFQGFRVAHKGNAWVFLIKGELIPDEFEEELQGLDFPEEERELTTEEVTDYHALTYVV